MSIERWEKKEPLHRYIFPTPESRYQGSRGVGMFFVTNLTLRAEI